MVIPVANWKGAAAGMITSHIVVIAITFGHLTLEKSVKFLETSIEGCTNETFSSGILKPASNLWSLSQIAPIEISTMDMNLNLTMTTKAAQDSNQFPQNVFAVTYMYYSLLGTVITVGVGTIISLLTSTREDAYDSKLLHPMVYKMSLCKWFPGQERYYSDQASNEGKETQESQNHSKENKESRSSLKVTMERDNDGFEMDNSVSVISEQTGKTGEKYKSNLLYNSDLTPKNESYKKLSEDGAIVGAFEVK